jgi:hypothetical protein
MMKKILLFLCKFKINCEEDYLAMDLKMGK